MPAAEVFPNLYRINLRIPRGGFESFLDGWLITDKKRGHTILVETGPACAVPDLLHELALLKADRIDHLIYTHIHLDHAGGAGHFSAAHPEARILAPEKGRPHIANPSRLIEASKKSLGALFETYGTPLPVPPERLTSGGIDGLTVIDTPGHSPHHSSYIYELDGKRILFAGEAAGCFCRTEDGDIFMRPASPHKFFFDSAISSLDKLLSLQDIDITCFPHSGFMYDAHEKFEAAKRQMLLWHNVINEEHPAGPDEAVAILKIKDTELSKLQKLPRDTMMREEHFIRQSAEGFRRWIFKV